MQQNKWIKWLSLAGAAVLISACGGGASDLVVRVEKTIIGFYDQDHGSEPWVTDGEANGTKLLKDMNLGEGSSHMTNVVNIGESYYFMTSDKIVPKSQKTPSISLNTVGKLWKSDGTAEGTVLVKDMTGIARYAPWLVGFQEKLYFFAGNGLWKINSAENDMVLIKEFSRGGIDESSIVESGDKLYFNARDEATGIELWVSDGTPDGTRRVKDIREGEGESSSPWELTDVGGILYFSADDGVNGRELWKSDGTTEGTMLVKSIEGAPYGSSPEDLVVMGDILYFNARDSVSGGELWRSDGTAENTKIVKNITEGALGSDIRDMVAHKGKLYFTVNESTHELWVSDGTEGGTKKVKDLDRYLSRLTSVTDRLVFMMSAGEGTYALWSSDGTETGTKIIKVFNGYTNLTTIIVKGSLLIYTGNENAYQLWKTDGTAEGTVMIKESLWD